MLARLPAIGAFVTALGAAVAAAGPGDPFGEDAGCVPATADGLRCGTKAAKAVERLRRDVIRCHAKQAEARFGEVVLGQPSAFDEEACESAARAKLDDALDRVVARCGAGGDVVAGATLYVSELFAGGGDASSLDALNAELYCDGSSGVAIDPGDDDGGTVPSTANHLHCGERVGEGVAKLAGDTTRCHRAMARAAVGGGAFEAEEETCEARAAARFDRSTAALAAQGVCPPCLDAGAQAALRTRTLAALDAANASFYPCAGGPLETGGVELDRPTPTAIGIRLPISGDADADAMVGVRYRRVGDPGWRDALPLLRVLPETVEGRTVRKEFAGSILDLRPGTSYEVELHAVDPDGPVDETLVVQAATRVLPGDPAAPRLRPVGTAAALAAALGDAQPGDVIEIADGSYAGPFVLAASGTPANPIVVRGASTANTILDGGGCTDCNVIEIYGSFVHVERLTLQSAVRGIRWQTAGAEGDVLRRVRIADVRLGVGSRSDQRDFYICDNVLVGRLAWPQNYFDGGPDHSDDDGIHVDGDGHVICHNDIVGFGDAIKNGEPHRAFDVYGNEIRSAYDNGAELDFGEGNVRLLRNRFTNTFVPVSFQPIYGGPAYAIRNVAVNVAHEQLKFHGVFGDAGPSGVLVYHNTFVSSDIALTLQTPVPSHNFVLENNLFATQANLAGQRVVDWTGPIVGGRFEYDGWFPDGQFVFNLSPAGLVVFDDLADVQASGLETQGRVLTAPIFASGLVAPADSTVTMTPQDVTLDAASNARDAGRVLANVNDGFAGAGPDLGALERGCPLPIYGVRPAGVDESTEPFGCAP